LLLFNLVVCAINMKYFVEILIRPSTIYSVISLELYFFLQTRAGRLTLFFIPWFIFPLFIIVCSTVVAFIFHDSVSMVFPILFIRFLKLFFDSNRTVCTPSNQCDHKPMQRTYTKVKISSRSHFNTHIFYILLQKRENQQEVSLNLFADLKNNQKRVRYLFVFSLTWLVLIVTVFVQV